MSISTQQEGERYQEDGKNDALSSLFSILNRDSMVMAQSHSTMGELMYISFASAFRTEAEAQEAESAINQLGYNVTRNNRRLSVSGNFFGSEVQELAKSFTLFGNLLKKASKDATAGME